jgi:hypothetical protein
MRALLLVVFLLTAAPRDGADDQYQFIAGLADKGMHERVVAEAGSFLTAYPRHAKAELARYRLACALFERAPHERSDGAVLRARAPPRIRVRVRGRLPPGPVRDSTWATARAPSMPSPARSKLDKEYLRAPARWLLGEARFRCDRFARPRRATRPRSRPILRRVRRRRRRRARVVRRSRPGASRTRPSAPSANVSGYPKGERSGRDALPRRRIAARARPAQGSAEGVREGRRRTVRDGALRGTAFALAAW